MKISNSLYVVGSGDSGFGITNEYDCTVFLLKSKNGFILIDSGCGLENDKIISYINKMGFSLEDCKAILITHAHADHVGGVKALAEIGNAEVFAWKEAAEYIENQETEKISLDIAIKAGVYPEGYTIDRYDVTAIEESKTLNIDGLNIDVIPTFGHCSGHCSYLVNTEFGNTLFSGDCVFLGGKIALQNIWDCNLQEYSKSIKLLSSYNIDALIPSHYGFVLSNGNKHIQEALSSLDKLIIPKEAGYFA